MAKFLGWVLICVSLAACGFAATRSSAPQVSSPTETVLVVGATGSIGKFVVQDMLARGHRVRGLTREPAKARAALPNVEWMQGDLREPRTLEDAVRGCQRIVYAAGSRSWADPTNTPEKVDYGGVAALADLSKQHGVKRLVVISSAGVTQALPGASEHLRNVLHWKRKAEEHVRASGVEYAILRPLGMYDEPGGKLGVALLQGDVVRASVTISRQDLASVASEAAFHPDARNKTFELFNAATFKIDGWKLDLAKLDADR